MRYLLCPILLLAGLSSISQEGKPQTISAETKDHKQTGTSFGFKTGFNRSDINGFETDGDKTGYTGGELYAAFYGDSRISTNFSLGYELLFSWTNDYHFAEIPVHLRYRITNKWTGFAGPKLDILVDDGEQFNNLGISAEGGIQYRLLNWVFLEGRYAHGFTRHVNDPILDINNARRNTFRIGAGIRF